MRITQNIVRPRSVTQGMHGIARTSPLYIHNLNQVPLNTSNLHMGLKVLRINRSSPYTTIQGMSFRLPALGHSILRHRINLQGTHLHHSLNLANTLGTNPHSLPSQAEDMVSSMIITRLNVVSNMTTKRHDLVSSMTIRRHNTQILVGPEI